MREKNVCRQCAGRVKRAGSGRGTFFIPGATPHYAPDLPFKLEHLKLDVTVDPKAGTCQGTVTHRVRVVAAGQRRLFLDQIGLEIQGAKVGGREARCWVEGAKLEIELEREPGPGDTLEFEVRYRVTRPRRGLYFTGPDTDHPSKTYQVWSQGQDEDNHYWFPTFDYPNQKVLTEVVATVPKGFTAVSNGALVSRDDAVGGTRFHYRLGTPHVTYLITLAVGEFAAWQDAGPRGLPVQYFVAKGREDDGKRAFGATPHMIEEFEKRVGVPYPYEKYSQVAVQDFIFGGMENTSATTQTDLTLHDARAHLDFTSDYLVSHELAHQWFGDLLTCRDWSHAWLNEGFATFMERVWLEKSEGLEEAKYYQSQDLKEYLDDDANHYRRAIVCNTYLEPIDLFDTHLYQKGGLVLNLIRAVLGEESFWKSIQAYVAAHRGKNVETLDLIRAIEETTGRNLRRLFDEWVFGAGHPEFELSYQWHEDKKMAELVVEQKQTGGAPSITRDGVTTHLFHLPAVIELALADGTLVRHTIELGEARDRVYLSAPSKPKRVRFDPGNSIPKTMKFPRPKELLLEQLAHDPDCMGRIEAAHELSRSTDGPTADVVAALGRAAASDAFWGVQAEAAGALARVGTPGARDALLAALGAKHPKARRAVVRALGAFHDPWVVDALRKVAQGDASYYVEADAVEAWAQARALPGFDQPASKETAAAEDFLLSKLQCPSYREVVRAAALKALSALPGIARGERPRALDALFDWTRPSCPLDARTGAMRALGQLLRRAAPPERERIFERFEMLAEEDYYPLRMTIVRVLAACEDPRAIATLSRIRELDTDGRVRRDARDGIEALRQGGGASESVARLGSALEKLEEEQRKLRALVEEARANRA